LLVYTIQAISSKELKTGWVKPSGTNLMFSCKKENINEVRIVPRLNYYVLEVIYEKPIEQLVGSEAVAGVDIGLNNLAAVTSNQKGFKPFLVNGRPVKAINNYYNKQKAKLQSQLPSEKPSSNRIQKLATKRGFKIDDYLHKASRFIINKLVESNVATLIIGKNPNWKQQINIGKANNQQLVSVPHARFIEMLTYKAQLVGIKVIVTEESYTSVASFLDLDAIPVYGHPKPRMLSLVVSALNADCTSQHLALSSARISRKLQYPAKSSPRRLRQWDKGCSSSPSQGHACKLILYFSMEFGTITTREGLLTRYQMAVNCLRLHSYYLNVVPVGSLLDEAAASRASW
jgi:IS605 OrfB family transposase